MQAHVRNSGLLFPFLPDGPQKISITSDIKNNRWRKDEKTKETHIALLLGIDIDIDKKRFMCMKKYSSVRIYEYFTIYI